MRVENGKTIRNKKGAGVPTQMISFRAEPIVFTMIEQQRALENLGRSEFIVKALTDYCSKNGRK